VLKAWRVFGGLRAGVYVVLIRRIETERVIGNKGVGECGVMEGVRGPERGERCCVSRVEGMYQSCRAIERKGGRYCDGCCVVGYRCHSAIVVV